MKVLSTRVHGVFDYLMVVLLLALPWVLNWGQALITFMMVMAGLLFAYSLVTRYELGILRAIPMPTHLLLDYLSGAAFLGAALYFAAEPAAARVVLALIGLTAIAVAAMTNAVPVSTGNSRERPLRQRRI
jgi:hypothetical protein